MSPQSILLVPSFRRMKSGNTLGKQIFEKYFLCCIKQSRPCYWSSVTSSPLQMFFKQNFIKISSISQKSTCEAPALHPSLFIVKLVKILRTPFSYRISPVAASDLSFVQIPKLQGPYSSVSTVFFTSCCSSYLFEETIAQTISSVIARITKKAFWILFTITTM